MTYRVTTNSKLGGKKELPKQFHYAYLHPAVSLAYRHCRGYAFPTPDSVVLAAGRKLQEGEKVSFESELGYNTATVEVI